MQLFEDAPFSFFLFNEMGTLGFGSARGRKYEHFSAPVIRAPIGGWWDSVRSFEGGKGKSGVTIESVTVLPHMRCRLKHTYL